MFRPFDHDLYGGVVPAQDGQRQPGVEGQSAENEEDAAPAPARSIREKSITCLECGKSFKLITKKHLAQHGLDADSYRRKWGIKSGVPLVCKSIQRVRRKKMKDMKLWEKRHAPQAEA